MLIFLKLGGSLITDKQRPQTALPDRLAELATQVATACSANPNLKVLVGHGSGSFGHQAARQYGTRQGVRDMVGWLGFAQVAEAAQQLNRLVLDALRAAGLPALAFAPSASAHCRAGQLLSLAHQPIRQALQAGLLPVVYGDVAFDETLGGTVVSTEEVFRYLADRLHPQQILLAGIEAGVLHDYPHGAVLARISPANFGNLQAGLQGSAATDVTGGMDSKVREMLAQVQAQPQLQIRIYDGRQPDLTRQMLLGISQAGTCIASD
jgi:isopentenyl phosphate kinase